MNTSAQRMGDKKPDIADDAQEAINDAANHPWVERAARIGYAANAVMHLLIGIVAVRLATGGGGSADQGGALGMLTENTWGKVLLGIGAFGWAALAFWQIGEACLSFHETKTRLKAAAKAGTYAVLSGMCIMTLARGQSSSSKQQNASMTGKLMENTAGVILVGLAGAVIVGVGIYHVVKGVKKKFFEDLQKNPGKWAEWSGVIGYSLKGLALVLTGVFFVNGAITHDPKDTGGLDTALKSLLDKPLGSVMVAVIGIGFVAFAVYSAARSKYARV